MSWLVNDSHGVTDPTTTAEDLSGFEGTWGYIDGSNLVAQGDDAFNAATEYGGIIVSVHGAYSASGNEQKAVLCMHGPCYAIVTEAMSVGQKVSTDLAAGVARTKIANDSGDFPRGFALQRATAAANKIRIFVLQNADEVIP